MGAYPTIVNLLFLKQTIVSFLLVVMVFNIQIEEFHEEVLPYLPVSGVGSQNSKALTPNTGEEKCEGMGDV
jgi:hypothetical protein